jgi:hypothetical protein
LPEQTWDFEATKELGLAYFRVSCAFATPDSFLLEAAIFLIDHAQPCAKETFAVRLWR